MAAEELITYLESGNIVNSVNYPNVSLPKSGEMRFCVLHKNVSGTLSKISTAFSDAGINIENMINGSKKDYAYTIVDLAQKVDAAFAEKLTADPDVIKVRVI